MIFMEVNKIPDKDWNVRLLSNVSGTFLQSKEFLQSEELCGNESLFINFMNNTGKIVGQIGIILYPLMKKKGKMGTILKKIPGIPTTLARWFYGPIIFDVNYTKEINDELRNFLIKKKFKVWGSEHPLSSGMLKNMKPFHSDVWGTFLIDLSQDKDVIWKSMDKHSARKNIERSKSRNVIVKQMNKNDLGILYELEISNGKIDDSTSLDMMEKQWDILQPANYSGFIAYIDDQPIGAMKFSTFNQYIIEFEVVRDKRDTEEKLYSQDNIKWKIIESGINNRLKFYDLSGVNPYPTTKKDLGIFHYKSKWGGKLIKYNILKS